MIKFKVFLFAVFSSFVLNALSQIKPFEFTSYKDYPNGRRIAYFYVQGIACNKEAQFIIDNITQLDEIYRFSVFAKKGNENYCMVECDQNIDADYIYKLMLQIETEYNNEEKPDPTFPSFVNTGHPQEDNARYDEAKQKWIKEHPEKYYQLAHPNGVKTNESKKCK